MSLGPILREKRVSDGQFAGDLSSLFARHRIAPGSAYASANFESRFALSEAFRSQLFTLCTAISHMSEADLTGEQLLALIARALDLTETMDSSAELPEWVQAEFQDGYDAWNMRDLSNADEWQTRRQPVTSDPIPFPQPAEAFVEPAGSSVRTPGSDMFQEPYEVAPSSSTSEPRGVAGFDLEHPSLDELTGLIKEMENRIVQMKPHIRPLADIGPEQQKTHISAFEQVNRPVRRPAPIDDKAFLARHAYLTPARRVLSADRVLQIAPSPIIASEGVVRAAAPSSAVAPVAVSPPPAEVEETAVAAPPSRKVPAPPRDRGSMHVTQPRGRSRVSLRTAIEVFAGFVMFVIIVGGLAGIFFYPSALSTYFNQPPKLGTQMQKGAEITQVGTNPGPFAKTLTNDTSRAADTSSHRALSHAKRNAQRSNSKPAPDVWPPQPQ